MTQTDTAAAAGFGSPGYRAYVLGALLVVYVFNFIDENHFLVSYPEVADMVSAEKRKRTGTYSPDAFVAKASTAITHLPAEMRAALNTPANP